MADNTHQYGFRFHSWKNGPVDWVVRGVATAQNDTDDGAAHSVGLWPGDPVKQVNTGGVTLAITTEACWGIIMGVKQYWDGTVVRKGSYLPNATAWGTVESRRSELYVCPVEAAYWEIDCDDAVTATTRAAYHAFIGENCTHVCPGIAWGSTYKADPKLDISLHAVTNTLVWRIEGISSTKQNRFWDGNYVKLIVSCNQAQRANAPEASEVIDGV
jgi:hypothetical protein